MARRKQPPVISTLDGDWYGKGVSDEGSAEWLYFEDDKYEIYYEHQFGVGNGWQWYWNLEESLKRWGA